jgi:hypothetical protein
MKPSLPDVTELYLSIAGITVRICSVDPVFISRMRTRYQGFSKPKAPVSVNCEITHMPENDAHITQALVVNFLPEGFFVQSPAAQGQANLESGQAKFTSRTTQFEGAVDYFLRMLYAFLVFDAGGVMLHGAGIWRSGVSVIFFGHSGSGKTTVSRLSGEEVVLNDDLIVLMPMNPGWSVHSTPFWNPSQVKPIARNAALGGLFRLVQDKRVYVRKLSAAEALAELVSSVPVINSNSLNAAQLLDRLVQLNTDCPVYNLHFLPDDSFWQVVDPLLVNRERE